MLSWKSMLWEFPLQCLACSGQKRHSSALGGIAAHWRRRALGKHCCSWDSRRAQPEDSAAESVQGCLVAFRLRSSTAARAPQHGKGHTRSIEGKCAQKGAQQFLGFKSGLFCPWGLCYWRQSWAAPAKNKEGNLGEINIQHSNCFLVYCTRLLQNIKNREESLKYTVNFIITKRSLTQQPLKSTENISQALLGAGARLHKANSFLTTSS